MRILIGDITSYKAIVIVKYLKKNYNSKIYAYSTKSFAKKIKTKYVDHIFILNKAKCNDDISIIINKHSIDYFFPVINEELSLFWKNKTTYFQTLDYLGDFEAYKTLNDKRKLYDLAVKLDIKAPTSFTSTKDAVFPYVIKPTNLSSAKGVLYVNNPDEVPQNINSNNIIIQQYIEGVGVGYSFYCKEGSITIGYGHKRLAEYPVSGGSSTYREKFINIDMIEIAAKIVNHINYTGFAMFEYKLTQQGDIYLIEVNPRIWGSINQGLANGVNYFESILGKSKKPVLLRSKEIKTYLSPLIYASLIKYSFSFKFKPLLYFLRNIRNTSPDVSLLEDPKGYFSLLLRKLF
jgi:predicted ATP-grasp superfamily ATP-dependent carboligase